LLSARFGSPSLFEQDIAINNAKTIQITRASRFAI